MKRRVERWLAFSVWAALVTFALPSYAQQVTQSFDLHPGWNAIYLEVEPEPERTSDVFQGLPVASVWAWIPRRSSAEFIQDPNEQLLSEAGWLGWFPDTRPEAFLTDLFTLQSNRAYLVNVEGTSNVTLEVTGKPAVPRPRWTPDAFNLVGFHVDPGAPPTFANFLAPAAALSGQTIYGLNNDGSGWEPVDPDTTTIQSGEA
jgi:hypothetical protein